MRRAFTLIEMTVVLVVIAIVARLAVREMSRVKDRRLSSAADRQLEDLRRAVWDVRDGEPAGFLADMGRMPRSADGTLSELWTLPQGAARYAVKPASAENLCVPDSDAAELADPSVVVPTGWRGPYVDLPVSSSRLRDPWGNPVEAEDSAGMRRLWITNSYVSAVSHYGSPARLENARTVSLEPDGGAEASLVVTSEIVSGEPVAGSVTYKWYGPASGLVTGAVMTVEYPSPARFEGLTPGIRIVKDSISGVPRPVSVRPGENMLHIRIAR